MCVNNWPIAFFFLIQNFFLSLAIKLFRHFEKKNYFVYLWFGGNTETRNDLRDTIKNL